MRNDGKMSMAFNNPMLLPDDFLDVVTKSRLRSLENDDSGSNLPIIEILSVAGIDDDQVAKLGLDWVMKGFSAAGLEFEVFYSNPLEVSQGDAPDIATVRLNMGQFTDEFGQAMANNITVQVEVPRQIPSVEEA